MSHRLAQSLLLGVLLAFFSPVLLGGRILLNHDLGREIGALDQPGERRLANRLSDDQTSTYLPELQVHLTGERSGWLTTWNPHVELGRPTGHLSGFSRVFLPTHALAFLTGDARVAYGLLVVLATALTAAFGYGFLRSLSLAPAACLLGGLGCALNVWAVHRVNAAMFLWGLCWTLAILWATVRTVERVTWPRLLAVAFSVHALVLTAYPQQVVWHAYFLVGFALVRIVRRDGCAALRARVFLSLAGAVLVGAATTLPVVLDLALAMERSGRGAVDPDFFLAGMRSLGGIGDAARLLLDHFDPYWFGDPSQQAFPLPFHGVCTGALGVLVPLSLLDGQWRRLWGWQLFCLIAMIVSVSPALYRFGIEYLGLGLSRFGPPSSAVIPAVVLAAYGADHVLRSGVAKRVPATALVLAVPLVAAASLTTLTDATPLFVPTALGVTLCLGVLVFVWTRSSWLLAALAVIAVFHYGFRLLPLRELAETPITSPLVEKIREHTSDGTRFAWVGRGARGTLPSNVEGLVGLRSVHAYDPLAWKGYQDWVLRISEKGMAVSPPGGGEQAVAQSATTYGRHFRRIRGGTPDSAKLNQAGVSTLLSTARLDPVLAKPVGRVAGVGIYKTGSPRLQVQSLAWSELGPERVALESGPGLNVERIEDTSDRLRFRMTPQERPTLLVVSQQYHPQWHATSNGAALRTVSVDGFTLGVVLPERCEDVELAFVPHARWMWIPQLGFVLAGALSLLRRRPAP